MRVMEILSDTAVGALMQIYGNFDVWQNTKIEQVCRETKILPEGKPSGT